jgi:thioredoxin 1
MKITSKQLQEKIDSGEKFIVDLYADWCGPCRMLGPIVESVGKKLEEDGSPIKVYKFNIEEDKDMANKLGVRSIPFIKVFSGGENVNNKVGLVTESQLLDMVKKIL